MSEDGKIAKSTWITFGVAGIGFLIFIIVFVRLQGDHEGDVERCVDKCKASDTCRSSRSIGDEDPCEAMCGIAPTKAASCIETAKSCGSFQRCVVDNP
jgi:hypothetical protein